MLTEQVELLKTVKADKVNMEDNLAAKADMIHVLRKVSHDHFENRMEQMDTMVQDTFTRLDAHVRHTTFIGILLNFLMNVLLYVKLYPQSHKYPNALDELTFC